MTTQLDLHKDRILSTEYIVQQNGKPVATINTQTSTLGGEVTINDHTLKLNRPFLSSRQLELEDGQEPFIYTTLHGFLGRKMVITHQTQQYIVRNSRYSWRLIIEKDGQKIGTIYPKPHRLKQITAKLPTSLPLPIQIFIVCSAMEYWNKRFQTIGYLFELFTPR